MASSTNIPLGQYLVQRLSQLGIRHAFGVPGDFNLTLLDHFVGSKDHPSPLKWVGFCNELNAAYAADGYARVKGTPMALITTYGVGELSALNGVSGAFAENVPIIHIVGTTGRPIQEKGLLIHHVSPPAGHAPGPADHRVYPVTSKPFSCKQVYLTDRKEAPQLIDEAIEAAYKQALPSYIYFPVDMVPQPVDSSLLSNPLNLDLTNQGILSNTEEDQLVDSILSELYSAKNPCILADTLTERLRARDLALKLMAKTEIPAYSTLLAKGLADETTSYFGGVYNGELSSPGVAEAVHSSDCVLNLGPLLSDSNTGGFTRKIKDENLIVLHPLYVQVKGKMYNNVHFYPILSKLLEKLDVSKLVTPRPSPPPYVLKKNSESPAPLALSDIVEEVSKLIKPGDVVIPEVGTIQFAAADFKFPTNIKHITQVFYSSIGFSLPAAVGAAFAQRELLKDLQHSGQVSGHKFSSGRVVLVEGDGSSQMTIQELGTMVRYGLDVTVILLNNSGYSIERAIWGPKQQYNDICPNWKWTKLLEAFGGTEGVNCFSTRVSSKEELAKFVEQERSGSGTVVKGPKLVEAILDPFDYPWRLESQVQQMGKYNIDSYMEYSGKHDK